VTDEEDWRLRARLGEPTGLEHVVREVRRHDDDLAQDVREALAYGVVLTHDGNELFAYAPTRASIEAARTAIESVLRREQQAASIRICHWDEEAGEWRQVEPPLTGSAREAEAAQARAATRRETRTISCVAGRLERELFEADLTNYARGCGLDCRVVEHPHLLSTQIAFSLTGPVAAIDDFQAYATREARRTIRVDSGVIPFGGP
jgi:hypothetical protein